MRFVAWNINRGGGQRITEIVEEIKLLDPDFVALSEVTYGNLDGLRNSLTASGLVCTETTCEQGNAHSVLVASNRPIEIVPRTLPNDQERWLSVRIESLDLNVLAVHIPDATTGKFKDGYGISGERRKQNFWDEVIRYAQANKNEKTVLLGDLNTGLKEDAQGTPFKLSDNIRILRLEKYVDAWRHLNAGRKEYTYYSQQNSRDYNGFRLDYVFVSALLRDRILKAEHVHHVRGAGKLSDHSIVLSELAI